MRESCGLASLLIKRKLKKYFEVIDSSFYLKIVRETVLMQ
jgi:hypothetical protein